MTRFLQQVAQYVYRQHPQQLGALKIVVPTRRAAFFLKRELGGVISLPIVSPDIVAIDDFVTETSGLHTTDPVNLLFELFETFRQVDAAIDFDRFMGWGTVLLGDFDRIDMAMVHTDYLFSYMTEAKALERWRPDVTGEPEITPGMKPYFSLFGNIRTVYQAFRERLFAQNRAYPGMAYRSLAEHPEKLEEALAAKQRFYFAGFNAFTASEREIVRFFTRSGRGEVLWDSDAYYLQENTLLEAGKSMREYRAGAVFGKEWKWMEHNLMSRELTVHVYGVPNATLQTRVAGQLYADILKQEADPGLTAMVLADENLLLPMLYALEESVKDVNITMGLPLRNSLLYTLIESIFDLQQNPATDAAAPRFSHRYVVRLFHHPFIRFYDQVRAEAGEAVMAGIITAITANNLVYLSKQDMLEIGGADPLLEVLFTPWPERNARKIIHYFYEVIDLLREVYRQHKSAIETEYLYLFYTLLRQFELTLENREEQLNPASLRQLLFELIRETKVPFSGEPVSDLQVIGMLETRALDFDRVIMLSVNEGVFPKRKRQNSLIPYDIARETGLPTYEHQEALSAYYFYRLLQRSGEIHLLYVNTIDGGTGGEKSRFIQQLEWEWGRYNPGIRVVNHTVALEQVAGTIVPPALEKDEMVLANILGYLTGKGLYPTHIHLLLNSPLDFYLKHVLGMEEEKETEEELGMDKIGTWLHDTFEYLDKACFLKGETPSLARIEAALSRQFENSFTGYVTDSGLNRIYFEVGKQQFMAFMQAQHLKPGHTRPVATEQHVKVTFPFFHKGREIRVKLGGKIDRVEVDENRVLRVMDYKTGSVEVRSSSSLNKDPETRDAYLTTDPDYKMNYVRQLWLYQYLVYRQMADPNGWKLDGERYDLETYRVESGFYSLRTPSIVIENPLQLVEGHQPQAYILETERLLGIILDNLLDPAIPLVRGGE